MYIMQTNDIVSRVVGNPDFLYVLLSALAIIAGAIVIICVVKFGIAHRERMAMIKQGIHPDYPPIDDEIKQNPQT
jgi:hypothetical protein